MKQEETKVSDINSIMIISEQEKSKVYLASAPNYHFPVVVKELEGDHRSIYERLQKVSSKHIPKIFEVLLQDNKTYVIEEYVDGKTLEEFCIQGLLDREHIKDYFQQICIAVQSLHQSKPPIIHRDLKPSNIMITEDGVIKLIDFDASREYKINHKGDTKLLGTADYAAPEQFGYSQTDVRSDIYALGVVLSEIVFGKSSDDTLSKPRIVMKASEAKAYRRIIKKCTMFSPDDRYQTISELLHDCYRVNSQKKYYICTIMIAAITVGLICLVKQRNKNYVVDTIEEKPIVQSENPEVNVAYDEGLKEQLSDSEKEDLIGKQENESESEKESQQSSVQDKQITTESETTKDTNTEGNLQEKVESKLKPTPSVTDAPKRKKQAEKVTPTKQEDSSEENKKNNQGKGSDSKKETKVASTTLPNNDIEEPQTKELAEQRALINRDFCIQHFYKSIQNNLRFNSDDYMEATIEYVTYQKVGEDIQYSMDDSGYVLKDGILSLKASFLSKLEDCYYQINVETGKVGWMYYVLVHDSSENVDMSQAAIANSWKTYYTSKDNDVTYLVNNTDAVIEKVLVSQKELSKDDYELVYNKQGITFKHSYLQQYSQATMIEFKVILSDGIELLDAIVIE